VSDAWPSQRCFSGRTSAASARNFQVFDPLDFIAELTQHIPDPRNHLVRYFSRHGSEECRKRYGEVMAAWSDGDTPTQQT
jgi:hypothetical protein